MIGSLKEFEQHRKKHGYEKPQVFAHPAFQSLALRIGGCLLSGILLALAFPGFENFTLAFIGLVPLMFAVQSVSRKRGRVARSSGRRRFFFCCRCRGCTT